MEIKLLFVGDVVGRPGRQVLAEHLPEIIKEHQVDCAIINAENASGGSGLTPQAYDKILKYGANLITLGDHLYRKREIIDTLQNSDCIVKPANLVRQAPGQETATFTTARGPTVTVVSLLGRLFMSMQADNPFHAVDRVLAKLPSDARIVVVDMHAEASSEKIAMGWFLDGRASAVLGTHTHVATADETILPKGTAYISDVGMTGPHRSVLGRNIEPVLKSLTTQMPCPYSIANEDLRINSVLVTVDSHTGKASQITRLCLKSDAAATAAYDADDGRPNRFNNAKP